MHWRRGGTLIQKERADNASQMWRLLPAGATLEFDAPVAPAGLKVTPRSASALLEWEPVADSGDVTYTVLRAGKGSDVYNTIARGLTLTSFLDNTVTEKEYSYKVFAMDASGNRSATSTPVSCETIGEKDLSHICRSLKTSRIFQETTSLQKQIHTFFQG